MSETDGTTVEVELRVIEVCVHNLNTLDCEAQLRVLDYLSARFVGTQR